MSALPPKADVAGRQLDVRLVPISDSYTATNCPFTGSPRRHAKRTRISQGHSRARPARAMLRLVLAATAFFDGGATARWTFIGSRTGGKICATNRMCLCGTRRRLLVTHCRRRRNRSVFGPRVAAAARLAGCRLIVRSVRHAGACLLRTPLGAQLLEILTSGISTFRRVRTVAVACHMSVFTLRLCLGKYSTARCTKDHKRN
jgi:hypothetical protein